MPERYIAFDVETPNYANDRMSAIGITVIQSGRIVEEFASIINPECHFDRFNIQLTGITPDIAAQAPTFDQLWPRIEPMMSDGLLIAHNAPFDMSVLSKCLRAYQIPWKTYVHYACTCQIGRRCYPGLPNHRLNTLCDYLDIELDHHRAESDSRACAQLMIHYLECGIDINPFRRGYDLLHTCTLRGRECKIV